jgi:hypothetical protein
MNPVPGGLVGAWLDASLSDVAVLGDIHGQEAKKKQNRFDDFKAGMDRTIPRIPRLCHFCGEHDMLLKKHKKCGGCKDVSYCDAVCQKKDWKVHKITCN